MTRRRAFGKLLVLTFVAGVGSLGSVIIFCDLYEAMNGKPFTSDK